MKVHSFIQDTKAMANNEEEAIAKRIKAVKRNQNETARMFTEKQGGLEKAKGKEREKKDKKNV